MSRTEDHLFADLFVVLMEESLENVAEDGERSVTKVRQKAEALQQRRRELYRELGREVADADVYDWADTPAGQAVLEAPPEIAEGLCEFCGCGPVAAAYTRLEGHANIPAELRDTVIWHACALCGELLDVGDSQAIVTLMDRIQECRCAGSNMRRLMSNNPTDFRERLGRALQGFIDNHQKLP